MVRAGPGVDVLLKTDQVVAGRHFRVDTPVDLIARKAVARAVSDIAACGGTPLAALAAVTLPNGYAEADALFDAAATWAGKFGCPLVGGDIATVDGPLVLSISVLGRPHVIRGPVLRSGARAGDGVYVTGSLGGSFEKETGLGKHLMFEPRIVEAAYLCETLGVHLHAMMDVSDGVGRDAARLAEASGVGIELHEETLPLSKGARDWRAGLGDGEDYELLFAAAGEVPSACPRTGVRITRVGDVVGGGGVNLRLRDGSRVDVSQAGWDHGA